MSPSHLAALHRAGRSRRPSAESDGSASWTGDSGGFPSPTRPAVESSRADPDERMTAVAAVVLRPEPGCRVSLKHVDKSPSSKKRFRA